jgi:hypothetical protein
MSKVRLAALPKGQWRYLGEDEKSRGWKQLKCLFVLLTSDLADVFG